MVTGLDWVEGLRLGDYILFREINWLLQKPSSVCSRSQKTHEKEFNYSWILIAGSPPATTHHLAQQCQQKQTIWHPPHLLLHPPIWSCTADKLFTVLQSKLGHRLRLLVHSLPLFFYDELSLKYHFFVVADIQMYMKMVFQVHLHERKLQLVVATIMWEKKKVRSV